MFQKIFRRSGAVRVEGEGPAVAAAESDVASQSRFGLRDFIQFKLENIEDSVSRWRAGMACRGRYDEDDLIR